MKRILYSLFFLSVFLGASALENGKTYAISQGAKAIFMKNAEPTSGRNAVMWTDTKVPAQRWLLEKRDDGTYTFQNLYTDYYLGVDRTSIGGIADQRIFSNFLTRWNLEPSGDGYMIIPAENPDICLASVSANEGVFISLVDKANAKPERCVFTLNADNTVIPTSYNEDVRDAVMDGFLGQYYHNANVGHVLGGGGWWGDAEMFETILDAFATTGDIQYKEIFHELYLNFVKRNGADWSGNEYNDDITWMVLACLRAYKYFGVTEYITNAQKNFTIMYNRAHQIFGTLIWKQSQDNKLSTNSCINCPAVVAACYLAELTGNLLWYQRAVTIYLAQRKLLFNESTGEVWDSRAWNSDGTGASDFNHWVSTYNQGTMLGAAMAMYRYTKDKKYLDDARKIYNRSRDYLTDSNKIIKVCQTINGDLCGFKGILMRYVRDYAETLHLEEPLQWMEKNAWHAYQNRNSKGVIWSAWLTKTEESLKRTEDGKEKDVNNDAFGSSTAVSVAFNAHVNRQFSKNAIDGLEAINFDDIRFTQLADDKEDGNTPNTTPSAVKDGYVCFRNVDFGSQGLDKAIVRVNATAGRSYVKVYTDSISETTLLGRSTGFLSQEWQDAEIALDRTLSGTHDVFVQFSGTGVQFHNVKFANASAVHNVLAEDTNPMLLSGSELIVNCSEESMLYIYNVAGVLETSMNLSVGNHSLNLMPGVHICRLESSANTNTYKAIVK